MNKWWRVVYLGAVIPAAVIGLGLWSPLQQAVAHARAKAPAFRVDPFWPKPLPNDCETNPAALTDGYRATGSGAACNTRDPNMRGPGATKPWVTGEVAGHGIDSQDHVFIVTRGPQGSTNNVVINGVSTPTTAPTNLVSPETVIAHPSPSVVEFDRAGNVVNAWPPNIPATLPPWWTAPMDPLGCDGSPACHGATRGVPTGIHGLYVDYQDNVWIAGNGDGIVQKYSHDGSTLLLQIGRHNCCDNPCAPNPACAAAGAPGGGACGNTAACAASNKSTFLLNEPPNVRVDPDPDPVTGERGSIYIPDGYGNHRVVVFDRNGRYLRHWGGVVQDSLNPNASPHDRGSFASGDGGHPHCLVIGRDKLLYVCDRADDRILVFDRNPTNCVLDQAGDRICQPRRIITVIPGTGVTAGRSDDMYKNVLNTAGSAWDLDFWIDQAQSFFFEVDGGNEIVWTFDRQLALAKQTGPDGYTSCTTIECGAWPHSILAGFGRPGHMAGDFTFLHSIALDSRGNLFTGETINGRRIQKFVPVTDLEDVRTEAFRPSGYPDVTLRHYDPRAVSAEGDRDRDRRDRDDD